jgi:hypothetical protein
MATRDPMDLDLERRIAEEDAEPGVTAIIRPGEPEPTGPRPREGLGPRYTNPAGFPASAAGSAGEKGG